VQIHAWHCNCSDVVCVMVQFYISTVWYFTLLHVNYNILTYNTEDNGKYSVNSTLCKIKSHMCMPGYQNSITFTRALEDWE